MTVDAAGLCLKSGNAALLRGSASAFGTNTALVAVLTEAGRRRACPRASSSCCRRDRASVGELLNARGMVDVVIPRGGAGLIQRVVRESTVPVIETGVGNCHVYVDASADPAMAEAIVLQRQDPPGERLQRRGDAPGAPGRRRSCRGCCRPWPTRA